MLISPRIEVKAVEGDPLDADGDLGEARAHLGAEAVAIHAEVGRRVAQADEAREERHRSPPSGLSAGGDPLARARI